MSLKSYESYLSYAHPKVTKNYLVDNSGRLFAEWLFKNHLPLPRLLERNIAQPFIHAKLGDLSIRRLGHFL